VAVGLDHSEKAAKHASQYASTRQHEIEVLFEGAAFFDPGT
jgi:hypothetical protein